MILILRKDLKWPKGPLIAQACHAATSLIWKNQSHPIVQDYCLHLQDMHKVVLSISDLDSMNLLLQSLEKIENILIDKWIEEPEHVLSCVAILGERTPSLNELFIYLFIY